MSNSYASTITSAIALNPSFQAICDYNIQQFPIDGYSKYYHQLGRGIAILETPEQLNTYLASYSDMHIYKLNLAFDALFRSEEFNTESAEVIDWGCGQAFASCALIDYIKLNKINLDLSKFTLIEPSAMALQRGLEHIDAIYQRSPKPTTNTINDKADSILSLRNLHSSSAVKIHLFSNVLDLTSLDLKSVFQNVISNFEGLNYFVCVSPLNENQLFTFYNMFNTSNLISKLNNREITDVYRLTTRKKSPTPISRIQYIFKSIL